LSLQKTYDVIIIGGGASGLMCALSSSKENLSTLLLEHNSSFGKKILISGGGRCNFTNTQSSFENFVSENLHFSKSALAQYTPEDFLELVHAHKIEFYEKKLGQLFCKNSAREILEMLLSECARYNAELQSSTKVQSIQKVEDTFHVQTEKTTYFSKNLVIATGGLSIPKIGASDFGYKIAKEFGHKVTKLHPALDGFRLDQDLDFFKELSGSSLECLIQTKNKKSFQENILFTHKGLSGPAALQASLHWKIGEEIKIDLLPQLSLEDELLKEKERKSLKNIKNLIAAFLPKKFVDHFFSFYKIPNTEITNTSNEKIKEIAQQFHNWRIKPHSTVGYNKAEVTRGGISTKELSSKTLESKLCKGLYFIGEVVDVTGWLGGYNFQWAWASAHAASKGIFKNIQ